MSHTVTNAVCHSDIISTTARKPSQIYAEDQYQYHPQPESRHIKGYCSYLTDQTVDPLIFMKSTEYCDQDRQRKDHYIGDSSQYQSIPDQRFYHIHDRLPVLQGQPEISMYCIGEPSHILYCDSLIKSQPCSGCRNFFTGHHFQSVPIKRLQRISRCKSCQPENRHRQQKHNYCKQNDPLQDPDTDLISFVHNFPFPRPFTYM